MLCPICQLEMGISSSNNVIEVDKATMQPSLYLDQELSCRNKQCQNFQKVVTKIRHPLQAEVKQVVEIPQEETVINEPIEEVTTE